MRENPVCHLRPEHSWYIDSTAAKLPTAGRVTLKDSHMRNNQQEASDSFIPELREIAEDELAELRSQWHQFSQHALFALLSLASLLCSYSVAGAFLLRYFHVPGSDTYAWAAAGLCLFAYGSFRAFEYFNVAASTKRQLSKAIGELERAIDL